MQRGAQSRKQLAQTPRAQPAAPHGPRAQLAQTMHAQGLNGAWKGLGDKIKEATGKENQVVFVKKAKGRGREGGGPNNAWEGVLQGLGVAFKDMGERVKGLGKNEGKKAPLRAA